MTDPRHDHLRRRFDRRRLVDRALELPAAARTAFLDSTGGGDDAP